MASQTEARDALYEAIKACAEGTNTSYSPQAAAPILRDLSIAWRALTGGSQPGNVVVEK